MGKLMRQLEADKPLVECFSADGGNCRLTSACGLSIALYQAQEAFFAVLDQMDLAGVLAMSPGMADLLTALNHVPAEVD